MSELLRTSPGVALLTVGDGTVLHSADGRRLITLPNVQIADLTRTLLALSDWQERGRAEETVSQLTGCSLARSVAQIAAFVDAGLLELESTAGNFALSTNWEHRGWSDVHRYHRATRLLPVIDWSLPESARFDAEVMRKYLDDADAPAACLELPGEGEIHAAPTAPDRARMTRYVDTITTGAAEEPRFEDLVAVVATTFGRTGNRRLPVTGTHITKTSPSGGSRHPIEAFAALLTPLDGVDAGLFHWNVNENALVRLDRIDHAEDIRTHVIRVRTRPDFDPALAVILVAEVERSMFRYRESRSYRVLHYDAGHLLQTLAYAASSLGRPTYRGYTPREQQVTEMLNLDPLRQLPLAFGLIG